MKKFHITVSYAFALLGCGQQTIDTTHGSIEEAINEPTVSTKIAKTDVLETANRNSYYDCLLSGKCSPSHNNETILVQFGKEQFEATLDRHNIKVKGKFSSAKTPFPDDERNWNDTGKWITKLNIRIDGVDVFMPVLSYMDLSPPEKLYFRMYGSDKVLIFLDGNDTTLLRFSPIECDGQDTGEFEISERLDWYLPMYGDSIQHIKFKMPNCN